MTMETPVIETLLPWAGWRKQRQVLECPACGKIADQVGDYLSAGVYQHPVLGRYATSGEMISLDWLRCRTCDFWQVS